MLLQKEDLAKQTETACRQRGQPGMFKELLGVLKMLGMTKKMNRARW